MMRERIVCRALIGALAVIAAVPGCAAAREPLIVTPLADPDPNFRGPAQSHSAKPYSQPPIASSALEQAMQTFGKAIGQAAIVQQQQIQRLCREGPPPGLNVEQRFAYEVDCRYRRY